MSPTPPAAPRSVLSVQRAEQLCKHAGRDELRRLGITDVADLRSARELERRRAGPGARRRRDPSAAVLPILPRTTTTMRRTSTRSPRMLTENPGDEPVADAPLRYMTAGVPTVRPPSAGARRAVHQVISLLVQRPTGDHSLLRRQGPHRLHGRRRARGRWRRPRRHPGGLPGSNAAVAGIADAHPGDGHEQCRGG